MRAVGLCTLFSIYIICCCLPFLVVVYLPTYVVVVVVVVPGEVVGAVGGMRYLVMDANGDTEPILAADIITDLLDSQKPLTVSWGRTRLRRKSAM